MYIFDNIFSYIVKLRSRSKSQVQVRSQVKSKRSKD